MILKGEFGWGIAEGKIWRLPPSSSLAFLRNPTYANKIRGENVSSRQHLLKEAFSRLAEELKVEKKQLKKGKNFLDFPLSVLQDPQLWSAIREFLKQGLSAGETVVKAFRKWESALKKLDDSYLRLRIHDLEDLRQRILTLLTEQPSETPPGHPFIVVGKDLYVTDFLRLQHFPLQGIALEEGNESAHGVMLAKALGIPVAGRVKGLTGKAREGDLAILSSGSVYLHEKPKALSFPRDFAYSRGVTSNLDFRTKDKIAIIVRANVQVPDEIEKAKAAGAMGVGLFRTEFLMMQGPISVKEESKIYRNVLEAFHPDPVVFRLADFGSDKPYEKVLWPKENNPALGWRGLRFLLDRPEILNKQLQALCFAAGNKTIHILLPMVRTFEEISEFLVVLKPIVRKNKVKTKLGIMIETPSSVDLISRLPEEFSFVSLGTNDLLQYFFATDRIHPKIKADPLHPSFLRLLDTIIKACRRSKLSVSLCGEMAGDPEAIPVLLGLGLREFSVSVSRIPEVRKALGETSVRLATQRSKKCLNPEKCN